MRSPTGRARLAAPLVLTATLVVAPLAGASYAAVPAGTATGVSVTAGDGMITVNWTGATGAGVTNNYQPRAWSAATGGSYGGNWCAGAGGNGPCSIAGLTNGTTYYVDVYDTVTGTSSSPRVAVTPVAAVTAPSLPINVAVTPGNRQLTVTWARPQSNGGSPIVAYAVYASTTPDGPGEFATTNGEESVVVTGLVNGTTYYVRVRAINAAGLRSGTTANVTGTPDVAPAAPTGVVVTPGNGRLSVSWTASSTNGGSAIVGYQASVRTSPGGGNVAGTGITTGATTTGIQPLTNGVTYYVDVQALNATGLVSPFSVVVAGTPGSGSSGGSTGGGSAGGGSSGGSGGSSGGGSTGGAGGSSGSGAEGSAAVAPTITRVSPARGPVAGGTVVTIRGTGLTGATKVTIGGVRATKVTVVNATTIRFTAPRGRAGARAVTVTTPAGTATRPAAYTYLAAR